jgi:hypothetical protein
LSAWVNDQPLLPFQGEPGPDLGGVDGSASEREASDSEEEALDSEGVRTIAIGEDPKGSAETVMLGGVGRGHDLTTGAEEMRVDDRERGLVGDSSSAEAMMVDERDRGLTGVSALIVPARVLDLMGVEVEVRVEDRDRDLVGESASAAAMMVEERGRGLTGASATMVLARERSLTGVDGAA